MAIHIYADVFVGRQVPADHTGTKFN